MHLLLTWSDRAPGRDVGAGRPDAGPVMRLIEHTDLPYDAALVLTPRQHKAGARALAAEMRSAIDPVEVRALEVPDPSDHHRLFEALGELLKDFPDPDEEGLTVDVLLSAGTPQAQTLWVIMVQAGLLDARMLQVVPARFVPDLHPAPVREVKLDIEGFPVIKALKDEVVRLRSQVALARGGLIGQSAPMRQLLDRIARVALADVPVLVSGETGTGKEMVARTLHEASARADGPFVAVNCGAFGEGTLLSELFGHEAGAFTGARRAHRGVFEQADGGTLLLDEIGDMPTSAQVSLLRVLQEGEVRRVGGERAVKVDVRVIGATHRSLRELVEGGRFRDDLYYRLRGIELEVPPLRDRMADLELLVAHFLEQMRAELKVSRRVWQALHAWRWPGNVRELAAEVRRWSVFCDEVVALDALSPELRAAHAAIATGEAPPSALPGCVTPLSETIAEVERLAIVDALKAYDNNLSATARALGIDRNTLKRKMDRYELR